MKHLPLSMLLVALTGCGALTDYEGPNGARISGPRVLQEEHEGAHVYAYTVTSFKPKSEADWNFLADVASRFIHAKQEYGTYTVRFVAQETGQQFYVMGGVVLHDEIMMPRIVVEEKGRFVDSLKPRQQLLKQHPTGW